MALPVYHASSVSEHPNRPLEVNVELLENWLVAFLRDECTRRRGVSKAVLGLSGGVDSAVVAHLCARAFGPENVFAYRMPYKLSSSESLDHAQLVADGLGITPLTVPITDMVDGYLAALPSPITPQRLGNVCARCRMIVLFDQAAEVGPDFRSGQAIRASGCSAISRGMPTTRLRSIR